MSLQVAPLGQAHVFAVGSTAGDRAYLVIAFSAGTFRCDCYAGQRSIACRHVEAVRSLVTSSTNTSQGVAL